MKVGDSDSTKCWKEDECGSKKAVESQGNPVRCVESDVGCGEDSGSREESEIAEKRRLSPDGVLHFAALRDEVAQIREEHYAIRETLFRREGELDRTRNALQSIAQERDFLKKKVLLFYFLLHLIPTFE
ncbi:unnamed protein product, partial [Allacma fusca]